MFHEPPSKLQLVGKNLFPIAVGLTQDANASDAEFALKYCPSMDLMAVYARCTKTKQHAASKAEDGTYDPYADNDDDLQVDVYRLNGQKVFTVTIDSDSNSVAIVDVSWRDDGISLAIATSDNKVRLANSFSGKIVQTFDSISKHETIKQPPTIEDGSVQSSPSRKRKSTSQSSLLVKRQCAPTSIHYSKHFFEPEVVKSNLENAYTKRKIVLDDLSNLHTDLDALLEVKSDLPKSLSNIDIEASLPKLSTLPPFGVGDDDVFSTRTSLDAIFHSTKQDQLTTTFDALVIAHSDAHIHLRVFDSFEIGDIDLNQALNTPAGCKYGHISRCVTHPYTNRIYLLVEEDITTSARSRQTKRGPVKNVQLHLLSVDLELLHKSTHLSILASKSTQLYNLIRYLDQIQTQLTREIKTAFDLPARFIRTLEEDLQGQDGEGSTFETSACHSILTGELHGKFKEWLAEILGDRGVKRWEKAVHECLALTRRLISENWLPAVERAGVVLSRLMGLAQAYPALRENRSILKGLQDTIDVSALIGEDVLRDVSREMADFQAFMRWLKWEVDASVLEDTSEKLDEMREASEHREVRRVMRYVSTYLRTTSMQKYVGEGNNPYKLTEPAPDLDFLTSHKASRNAAKYTSPALRDLTSRLKDQCSLLFGRVASTFREKVMVKHVKSMTESFDSRVIDTRITATEKYGPLVLNIVARNPGSEDSVWISTIEIESKELEMETFSREVKHTREGKIVVQDIKFVDDDSVSVLCDTAGMHDIWSISMRERKLVAEHKFDAQDELVQAGLKPWKLEVNGRKNRRAMVVLDAQGRGYCVYDLESGGGFVYDDEGGRASALDIIV